MKRQTTLLQAVIVLGGFLALAFLCNQSGIEIHLALFAAWFLAMAVGKRNGFSYQEMEHAVTKGIYDGMSAILILLAVGALSGIVKVFVTDWLATSVQWMPFITQTTVWLTAPVLVVGAMLLSAVASAVSLRRYLKV